MNFESPQVHPITVARVNTTSNPIYWLLVCNTADSTLEIFNLNVASGSPTSVARIRVGLDPVSVLWHETSTSGGISGTIYTANMVGDSVSAISVANVSGTPTAKLVSTVNVGDEPMDLAYDTTSGTPTLYVTLNSRNALAVLDPTTLAPTSTAFNDPYKSMLGNITGLESGPSTPAYSSGVDVAINQPRSVRIATTRHPTTSAATPFLFVLGARGTHHDWPSDPNLSPNTLYKNEMGFDMWWQELNGVSTPYTNVRRKLGTKNFNMTFDSNGAAWIVSGDAANRTARSKPNVAAEPTGFLRTLLHLIEYPADPTSVPHSRDLNRQTASSGTTSPVAASDSLSHCTDVAVFEKTGVYKVYVVAFNNDGLGVINGIKSGGSFVTNGNAWTRTFINLARGSSATFGPTSLAIKYADTAGTNDPGDRVYVLNRFHNSVTVINPSTDTIVSNFALQANPTPAYIKDGRPILYSVKRGNGFNACASCHFDGRLDGLRWDLSESTNTAPFSLEMIAALEETIWTSSTTFSFTVEKGEFITQSLQGLVNYEVADPFAQTTWFTNKPYHWDMDQADLSSFGTGGFQNLLGGADLTGTTDMTKFIKFVNSIHYPPNYEESTDRKYHGGADADPNTLTSNDSGSLRGLKAFHILNNDNAAERGRSCVMCHTLPEGSNNLGTEGVLPTSFRSQATTNKIPLEAPAIRGMAQKETVFMNFGVGTSGRFDTKGVNPWNWYGNNPTDLNILTIPNGYYPSAEHTEGVSSPFLVSNALVHDGTRANINSFMNKFFGQTFGNPDLIALTQFVREFDTGVSPIIGEVHTLDTTHGSVTTIQPLMEQVRVGNCGLAVFGRIGGTVRGFWYDALFPANPPNNGTFYDISSGTGYSPTSLLGLMTTSDDVLVFEGVPLGMDRRFANPSTTPVMASGSAPSNTHLESMVPDTAYEPVPSMQANWDPLASGSFHIFTWLATGFAEPWDNKSIRLMQRGYLGSGAALHHEPPRRFRVSGDNIRPGAVLGLNIPKVSNPTSQSDYYTVQLPIYPTDKSSPTTGKRVWETAVEADPHVAGMLALGGYWAQGIDPTSTSTSVLLRSVVNPITESTFNGATYFNPSVWNKYLVDVINEDGTSVRVTNQQVTLEPAGFTH